MKNTKHIVMMVVGAVVVAGLGFGGGVAYGKSVASKSATAGGAGRGANGGPGGGRVGFRANNSSGVAMGSIVAADDKSITVQLANGGSKIIFFSDKTQVMKSNTGSLADLTQGANVMVVGTAGADGTITAQSIQIRPAGMPFNFGGRGQRDSASTTPQQ